MKILICSPINGVVGGIANWTRNIKNYYDNNFYNEFLEISFFDFSRKVSGQKIKSKFLKVYFALKDYSFLIFRTLRAINRFDGDIVQISTPASFLLIKDLILIKKIKRKGLKSIVHFHFGRIPCIFEKKNWEYKLILKVITQVDRVIVIDKMSYDTLSNAGFKNIDYLPNPLSPNVCEIINANKQIKKIHNKILFAGHVIPTKGVFELVKACKGISNIKLVLLGSVNENIKKQLMFLGGDDSSVWLDIRGQDTFERTIKEMLSAGVFVLPTYTEGFPNVIIESMACGCPIVTTDVGAIPEMLDIKNGFNCGICVKPKDVEGLKKAISKMLQDQNYATTCGRNAQKRVQEQYSMPIVWDKLISIWKSCMI